MFTLIKDRGIIYMVYMLKETHCHVPVYLKLNVSEPIT